MYHLEWIKLMEVVGQYDICYNLLLLVFLLIYSKYETEKLYGRFCSFDTFLCDKSLVRHTVHH
jgi:hypothetical protein